MLLDLLTPCRSPGASRLRWTRRGLVACALLVTACSAPSPGPEALAQHETGGSPCCGPITPAARRVLDVLDQSDVEHRWLRGEHVDWSTGLADRPLDYAGPETATHCSAYAAAIGARLQVYMLRPPEHPQELLANAQTRWFGTPAARATGWMPVPTAEQAQARANAGQLVVIAFASPNPHKPGHIAIVRPSNKSSAALSAEGPDITQAGTRNYLRTTAAAGFRTHAGAWPDGVAYFAHDLPAVAR